MTARLLLTLIVSPPRPFLSLPALTQRFFFICDLYVALVLVWTRNMALARAGRTWLVGPGAGAPAWCASTVRGFSSNADLHTCI
jgi:hypothetical protein